MTRGAAKTMGRPKQKKEASVGVAIRGSKEWRTWLMELADFKRLKATDVIDQALVEYAEKHGFNKPPPKR